MTRDHSFYCALDLTFKKSCSVTAKKNWKTRDLRMIVGFYEISYENFESRPIEHLFEPSDHAE